VKRSQENGGKLTCSSPLIMPGPSDCSSRWGLWRPRYMRRGSTPNPVRQPASYLSIRRSVLISFRRPGKQCREGHVAPGPSPRERHSHEAAAWPLGRPNQARASIHCGPAPAGRTPRPRMGSAPASHPPRSPLRSRPGPSPTPLGPGTTATMWHGGGRNRLNVTLCHV
jgi:hypothetical protein